MQVLAFHPSPMYLSQSNRDTSSQNDVGVTFPTMKRDVAKASALAVAINVQGNEFDLEHTTLPQILDIPFQRQWNQQCDMNPQT